MEVLLTSENLIALLTLTFLEVVLGIDNIIFISITANKLPKEKQKRARNIGLILAMLQRIALLFGISLIIALQDPLIHVLGYGFSGQALILIAGGLFLLYKSTTEIHHKLEGVSDDSGGPKKSSTSFAAVIAQITIIDLVFSFDSVLTAVGLTDVLPIMIIAIVLSVIIMIFFAGPISNFVNEHPTIQMLALSFLILIGFMLITEGAHLAHLIEATIPKGYIYFAIFFSLMVEFLNMRLRKKSDPLKLHNVYKNK